MTQDFYASYISGSIGILIGNPLDLIKVRLQAQATTTTTTSPPLTPTQYPNIFESASTLVRGTAAPILGYGALNAILFMTYNRTSAFLDQHSIFGEAFSRPTGNISNEAVGSNLWNIWIAGAVGGLATWIISTPSELIKCRAQVSRSPSTTALPSSLLIGKTILRTEGVQGLFRGGFVTALRDSIGYGFYFWSYELGTRLMASKTGEGFYSSPAGEATKVLLCGGVAGVTTWASVFPLDMIKTRLQTQLLARSSSASSLPSSQSPLASPALLNAQTPLLNSRIPAAEAGELYKPLGAWQITKMAYRTEGFGVFWRGFTVCCVRAFIVNAVQWATYEWIMKALSNDGAAGSHESRLE